MALTWVFWISSGILIYIYLAYPLLLLVIGTVVRVFGPRRDTDTPDAGRGRHANEYQHYDTVPTVTVIVAAFNESAVIADLLDRVLSVDYPADHLDCIVVSDGSTDATASIARSHGSPRVRVMEFSQRQGKTACQNAAVAETIAEVLVFVDANTDFSPGAVRALAAHFQDPDVGAVCGELHYQAGPSTGERYANESTYWSYEVALRRLEARLGVFTVFNGALYAIRRESYVPLDNEMISDFLEPLLVYDRGTKMVLERDAVARERPVVARHLQFVRKRRVILGGMYSLSRFLDLANPFRHFILSFELVSHKLLRWLTPIWIGAWLLSAIPLAAGAGGVSGVALISALGASLVLVAVGYTSLGRHRIFGVPAYAALSVAACAVALVDLVRGRTVSVWDTRRSSA